jgi:uncharacterized protein YqgV (UPF0045/DUF77 family)
MHNYTVNASIQILPVAEDRHPYEWVDEAIAIIASSGVPYEVGPFATTLEGNYEEVMDVIHRINEELYNRDCPEWICSVQLQIRSGGAITGEEKVAKHRQ